jgi:TatD DNase family protein
MIRYFDVHSHIHDKDYDVDRKEVLARMKEKGVGAFTVGTHLESSRKAVALAEEHDFLWATIGLHPTDTKASFNPSDYEKLGKHEKVVAIGECGLDYFRLKGGAADEKERQRENFLKQIEFAVFLGKPLMIHCRPKMGTMDAHEEMLSILSEKKKKYGEKLWGNIHFFTGTPEIANQYFAIGFSVSFSGVITFASEYDSLVRGCPFDMILSETDAPYASPVPFRGKRNEPVFVIETVRKIAKLKGESEERVGSRVVQNAKRIFNLPL